MAEVQFHGSNSPVTEQDIEDVEVQLGIKIPAEVGRLYLRSNGGMPTPHLFPKGDELFSVHEFFPIKYGRPRDRFEDIFIDTIRDPDKADYPPHLIPIADDPGGDYYCYSVKPGEFGAIYCYVWEYYGDPARSIIYLAANLDEFLDALIEEPN